MRQLSAEQEQEIQKKIVERTPDQLKLAFALWTRKAVCELILKDYGIRMPVRTCGEYLKRWGYTPQKPARRAYEQNPKAVKEWMERTYPEIARQAKDSGRKVILIVDNLRVHHSAPVKEWLAQNTHRIELKYLPSYSPERNPDEYLNGDLKGALGPMPPPASREELESHLKIQMRRLKRSPKHVASYFENQYVTFAKAA